MRKTSNKNFHIETENINISDHVLLRSEINNIEIKDNISVLACQPGIGKTTYILNRIEQKILSEIEENKKIEEFNKHCSEKEKKKFKRTTFAIFTKNHKLLREEYLPRLQKYGAEHIKGVTYVDPTTRECMCPDPEMIKYHDDLRSIEIVCGKICKKSKEEKKECPYNKQNKKAQIIFAHINNLNYGKGRDEIIIDESLTTIKEVKKAYAVSKLIADNFFTALKENDSKWIREHIRLISDKLDLLKTNFEDLCEWKKLKLLLDFDINIQLFLISNKYEIWYRPKLYDLFDIVSNNKNTKVIMLCATFDEKYFTDMLKSYSGEIGIKSLKIVRSEKEVLKLQEDMTFKMKKVIYNKKDFSESNISVKIFYTKTENKNTIVYHINPENRYSNSEPANMLDIMQYIHIRYPDVGCIGSKEFMVKLGDWGLHYGEAEGSNNYDDAESFIKIGSYTQNIKSHVDEYKQQYMDFDLPKLPKRDDPYMLDIMRWIEINCGKRCIDFINFQNYSKNYDAMHRNRGLWNNYRALIVFGMMPKGISEEFTIKEISCENKFIESIISEIIEETMNKNIQKEKDEEIIAEELLKQKIDEKEVTEEDFMNIPEPMEYEPEPEQKIPEIPEEVLYSEEKDEPEQEQKIPEELLYTNDTEEPIKEAEERLKQFEEKITEKIEICKICGKEIKKEELSACAGGGYVCKDHEKDMWK